MEETKKGRFGIRKKMEFLLKYMKIEAINFKQNLGL